MDYRVKPGDIQEDQVTAMLENVSAKWPTSLFLGAALGSMGVSLLLKLLHRDSHNALFIGQWAAPFLILGLYNKTVKQQGLDAHPAYSTGQEQTSNAA